jgi:hypothetical protein
MLKMSKIALFTIAVGMSGNDIAAFVYSLFAHNKNTLTGV